MIDKLKIHFCFGLIVSCLLICSVFAGESTTTDQWDDPFASTGKQAESTTDSLSLASLLSLVANANPTLKAGLKQIEVADGLLTQAGLWSIPELEIEFEEIGWDAPGTSEPEITVLLRQEIELWGNRKNRKLLARRDLEAVQLETKIAAFDIYATTAGRFFALGHAQRRVVLAQDAAKLAADIAQSARMRVEMGAAMQSELLLGQLETEIAAMDLARATSEMETTRTELAALWQGDATSLVVTEIDFDPAVVAGIDAVQSMIEGSREVRTLEAEQSRNIARLDLERSGARANLSLSGGYKRIEADGSNSFVVGVGLPLPFFNQNKGNIRSLEAKKDLLKYSRQQAVVTAKAEFQTSKRRIEQQISRYRMINSNVLPKAEETYNSLTEAYDKGKLPYTTLLEAQRMMLDLRFELNDIEFAIKQEIVSLERLLGVTIQ